MEINIEQIKEAVADNTDLQTQLVTLALQTEVGKNTLNNHLETSKATIYGDATNKAYSNVDEALTSLGFEKPQGAKSTEFLKEVITGLNEQIKNSKVSKEDKEALQRLTDTLKSDFSTKEAEYKQTIDSLNKKLENVSIMADINRKKWEYNPNIPEAVAKSYEENEKQKLLKTSKVINGRTVYHDENGNPYLNELRDYATAEEILAKRLEPILKKETIGGGGAGKEKPATKVNNGAIISDELSKATTRVKLYAAFMDAIKRQAITDEAKKNELWEATKEQYNFASMPEQ